MSEFYLQPEDYERAEHYGISKRQLERRFYTDNWDKERAITRPLHVNKIPPELVERAKANGITMSQLRWRLDKTDLTEDESVTLSQQELFERRIKQQSTVVPPNIKKLAESNGIAYGTVYRRIKKGMDPVQAATERPLTPKQRVNKRWNKGPKI